MTVGPPSNPPGMPPPFHTRGRGRDDRYDSSSSSTEASSSDEIRLLEILTKAEGELSLEELHYRSGLTSDRFRFWLNELEKRGAIERVSRDNDVFVALKGKLGR